VSGHVGPALKHVHRKRFLRKADKRHGHRDELTTLPLLL
jgi:hypothetical protein